MVLGRMRRPYGLQTIRTQSSLDAEGGLGQVQEPPGLVKDVGSGTLAFRLDGSSQWYFMFVPDDTSNKSRLPVLDASG